MPNGNKYNYNNIPEELKIIPQWVCWKWGEDKAGRLTKIPVNYNGGARARTNDPSTWGTFEQCTKWLHRYQGLGFIFTKDDPYTCVDLDHCINEQNIISDTARSICNDLDSYAERSQSGNGIHVIVRATKPGHQCRTAKHPDIEIYDNLRFIVMTGNLIPGNCGRIEARPVELNTLYNKLFPADQQRTAQQSKSPQVRYSAVQLSDQEIIQKAGESRHGDTFTRLWRGDLSGNGNDHSAADQALCNILAFWCNRDTQLIDRLFRQSGLMREKWERREDYRNNTINNAIRDCREVYTGYTQSVSNNPQSATSAIHIDRSIPSSSVTDTDLSFYPCTDLGNAERFLSRYGDQVRYCQVFGKWFSWDRTRWREDETGSITQLAAQTVRKIQDEAKTVQDNDVRTKLQKFARTSESEARIKAMLNLSRAWCGVGPDELDADPWLLNCQNGTLDLRNCELLPPRQDNLITKLAPVKYILDAECPTWLKFLDVIFQENKNLIDYIQRAVGYALTGVIREQCLFFLHGVGSNGKSTFLNTIQDILGDYARDTPTESLMIKQNDSISNDIARLKGARFVTAVEAEADKRMAESLVKRLTGGDTITARFMRQEFFQFRGTFKIFLAANHKPGVRGNDDGIWRRIKMIPFLVRIADKDQDPELLNKLKAEAEGIFAWMVHGCQIWQKQGLGEPEEVTNATAEYRDEMDFLGNFINECCTQEPHDYIKASDLYKAYIEYCEVNNDRPISQTRFGRLMSDRPNIKKKRKSGSGSIEYIGIDLNPSHLMANLSSNREGLHGCEDFSLLSANTKSTINIGEIGQTHHNHSLELKNHSQNHSQSQNSTLDDYDPENEVLFS